MTQTFIVVGLLLSTIIVVMFWLLPIRDSVKVVALIIVPLASLQFTEPLLKEKLHQCKKLPIEKIYFSTTGTSGPLCEKFNNTQSPSGVYLTDRYRNVGDPEDILERFIVRYRCKGESLILPGFYKRDTNVLPVPYCHQLIRSKHLDVADIEIEKDVVAQAVYENRAAYFEFSVPQLSDFISEGLFARKGTYFVNACRYREAWSSYGAWEAEPLNNNSDPGSIGVSSRLGLGSISGNDLDRLLGPGVPYLRIKYGHLVLNRGENTQNRKMTIRYEDEELQCDE